LKDNINSYEMQEDGSYQPFESPNELEMEAFDIQKNFFKVTLKEVMKAKLFDQEVKVLVADTLIT